MEKVLKKQKKMESALFVINITISRGSPATGGISLAVHNGWKSPS